MRIRPMTVADHDAITLVLDKLWSQNRLMRSQYRWHRGDWPDTPDLLRRSFVAEESSDAVGAGTIIESTLHPAMYVVLINVSPDWQNQGIGTSLYDHLANLASDRPWLVKVCDGDHQSIRFLKRRGFSYVTSSLIGILDPKDDAVEVWQSELPSGISGFRIGGLDESSVGLSRLAMAKMLFRVYAQYHQWNPPGNWSEQQMEDVFLGPNTIVGSEVWAMDGEKPIGAAVLFREEAYSQPNEAYLVHIGVVEQEPQPARRMTAQLIKHEMAFAAEKGLRVRFEADDEYKPHRAFYESSPAIEVNRDLCIMVGRPLPSAG